MDKLYIKNVIQNIINKEFSDPERKKIIDYNDRLNFCAPCCGDSHTNKRAKRGNLWFNRLFYVCFNCGKKTTFDRFCKDFNEQLDPDKKLEMIEYLDSVMNYSDYESDFLDAKFDDLVDLKDLEESFNVKKVSPIFDFTPVKPNSGIYKYLINRGIGPELHRDIYSAKFAKGDDGYEHVICLLNRKGDKILGLQVRNLKSGKKRFFVIYNWEHLYKWVNGEDVEIDVSKSVVYNKLSYFFNILNVNFDRTITIFEGYLDSLFYPNSIGVVGVNTDFKFLEDNNLDLRYFFDNDKAGFDKSEEILRRGGKIFLWKKLFEFIVSNKKDKDPHQLLNRISKVKDLNKLAELIPNPYKKLSLDKFFSSDVYDIKYLPKIRYKFTKE